MLLIRTLIHRETPAQLSERVRATARVVSFVGVALAALSVTAAPAFAQSICNAGNQVVVRLVEITSSCTVTGSLTIQGGMVRANFAAAPTASLRVEGNVR